jgi:hypothetical protein
MARTPEPPDRNFTSQETAQSPYIKPGLRGADSRNSLK